MRLRVEAMGKGKAETNMKLRLGFSVALVVVLFAIWVAFARPSCLDGYSPSLGRDLRWSCVQE
jgi:hypothetical protein